MDIAVFFWWVGSGLLGKHSCNLLRRIIFGISSEIFWHQD